MNTKLIMTMSAILLGSIGLLLTFFPAEFSHILNIQSTKPFLLVLQILGGFYFAFAILNWMAKGAIIGGIYNRPISIANLTHFFMAGMALLKFNYSTNVQSIFLWVIALIYLSFAIVFWIIMSRHPVANKI